MNDNYGRAIANDNRRSIRWNLLLLRIATLAYAFLFGMALGTGYEMSSIIMIGVVLVIARVVIQVAE